MEISRTKRFIGGLVNFITLGLLIIGNPILLITGRTTIGGIVSGYKYDTNGSLILLYFAKILVAIGYGLTLGILWIIDVIGMDKRNGTFAEKLVGISKVSR